MQVAKFRKSRDTLSEGDVSSNIHTQYEVLLIRQVILDLHITNNQLHQTILELSPLLLAHSPTVINL